MKNITLFFKVAWTVLCVIVLMATLYFFDGKPNSDADTLLAYGMLVLSFPMGLLVVLLLGAVGHLAYMVFGYVATVSYLSIIFSWSVMFAAGYLQWFVLLPSLLRRLRARDASRIRTT